jgi:signal recognition particle subunit SRP54
MSPKMMAEADVDPRRIKHVEAIIQSMTPEERRRPKVLNGSRRVRIARGAGRPVQEVNRLVKQFEQVQQLMKRGGRSGMAGVMQQLSR